MSWLVQIARDFPRKEIFSDVFQKAGKADL